MKKIHMGVGRVTCWALAVAGAVMLSPCTGVAQVGSLNDAVSRAVISHKLSGSRVGVSVIDMDTGEALADLHAEVPLAPASNMKLLTSGAALIVLGRDFVFKTELIRDNDRLIVRGAGDPSLGDPILLNEAEPKMTVGDMLSALAGAVVKSGMQDVREIVIDDRVFDREYIHAEWPRNQLDRPYCAEVSGLSFHANVISFFPGPNPQGVGTPPVFSLEPEAPWVRVDVKARTVADGKNEARVTREAGDDHFAIRGEVRFQTQASIDITCHEPAMFFGRLLASELTKSGVRIGQTAGTMSVRLAAAQENLGGGRTIAVVCTPIADVLRRCNTDSENLYAESLLKRMGNAVTKEPGSWNNGAAVLRMVMKEKLGPQHAAATTITDGSGLSKTDQVTPATLTRWLAFMAKEMAKDKNAKDIYTESLARPGVGTLKKRFQDSKLRNEVRGKSGLINGVRCLSGYVISPSGRRVAYSIMINDVPDTQAAEAKEMHEAVVEAADKWLWQKTGAEPVKVGG